MAKTKEIQIKELLVKLEKSTNDKQKRMIRKDLRSLGHRGGLNKPRVVGKKAKAKAGKTVTKSQAKANRTAAIKAAAIAKAAREEKEAEDKAEE